MIYFEITGEGSEGLNTHIMSYTLCISLSNFLDRDFYLGYEVPCSTPPDYASQPDFRKKYNILLESRRSLVSDLVDIPNRRVYDDVDHETSEKLEFFHAYSMFLTTQELRDRFAGTFLWDSFAIGREGFTREELQNKKLTEWRHSTLCHPSVFYFLPKAEKEQLLSSARIRFRTEIEDLFLNIKGEIGPYNAFHIRLGDFLTNYNSDQYTVNPSAYREFVQRTFDPHVPILGATDGLQEKDLFANIFEGFDVRFIDELIFDEYFREFRNLEFTDFNVLSVLNELLCAGAKKFVGTYRSTFTAIIHRIRQERFSKADFYFFPDPKISKLLSSGELAANAGFFDWNRYPELAGDLKAIGFMREWDYSRSTFSG